MFWTPSFLELPLVELEQNFLSKISSTFTHCYSPETLFEIGRFYKKWEGYLQK